MQDNSPRFSLNIPLERESSKPFMSELEKLKMEYFQAKVRTVENYLAEMANAKGNVSEENSADNDLKKMDLTDNINSDIPILKGQVIYSDNKLPSPHEKFPDHFDPDYNPMNDAAIDETWKYVIGAYSGIRGLATLADYGPYLRDIWAGRNLLFKNPLKMSPKELIHFKKLGEAYYKNYLQKHPVNVKNYGEIKFGKHNMGKDLPRNYEQYPFLRRNIAKAKKVRNTNTKNEVDRTYDHFYNTHKGNLFDYIIENIVNVGKRYKMMKGINVKE